ncbi:MAG: long-chain fatty acid--CoA ligase [Verrucomicrobia subdivision 3 bacterium]|nr:long-chain fatty acid--CoA ligase [Limisphaerales bacterium]
MNLAFAFEASARKHERQTAIFWGEQQFAYADLLSSALSLVNCLEKSFDVKPGDRVALWLKNCAEFVPALYGILGAGAVVVPINNFLKPHEVSYILQDCDAKLVVTDSSMSESVGKLRVGGHGIRSWNVDDFPGLAPGTGTLRAERRENDLAVIIYTSGTTGHPKGAMLAHGNLLSNVESCRIILSAVDTDRFVVLLPMFHSFMMTVCVLLPTIVGGSLVLIKSLHPPKNILHEIIQHRATILPAIPQFFRTLANASVPPGFPLRLCISGGAPLPGEILREFTEKMPIPLIEGYGLSEASPVVSMNPIKGPWKAGSIGVPIPGVKVTVQDEGGRLLPPGQTGEICVAGPNVMQGYWNRPEETAKALRGEWLLTGDIGHQDTDGYFFITDRKKDMLLVNGINVYPREIEEVIYQFPGVKEAAVIGVPDARKGEHPLAFVSAAEGKQVDEKALLHFVREKLADYKVPKRVVFMPALPRNATGKILKTALRQRLAASQ